MVCGISVLIRMTRSGCMMAPSAIRGGGRVLTRTSLTIIGLGALMAGIYYAGYSHGKKSVKAVLAEVNARLSQQRLENELLAASA